MVERLAERTHHSSTSSRAKPRKSSPKAGGACARGSHRKLRNFDSAVESCVVLLESKPEEGLEAVAKGQLLSHQSGDGGLLSIFSQLNGELLVMKEPHNDSAAEACFRSAINLAQSHQAKSNELAATSGLVRLLAKRGEREEARAMLAEIYNWFTEGFETVPEGRQGAARGAERFALNSLHQARV